MSEALHRFQTAAIDTVDDFYMTIGDDVSRVEACAELLAWLRPDAATTPAQIADVRRRVGGMFEPMLLCASRLRTAARLQRLLLADLLPLVETIAIEGARVFNAIDAVQVSSAITDGHDRMRQQMTIIACEAGNLADGDMTPDDMRDSRAAIERAVKKLDAMLRAYSAAARLAEAVVAFDERAKTGPLVGPPAVLVQLADIVQRARAIVAVGER